MAVDSATKRASFLNFGDGNNFHLLPVPDGTIDAGDRFHLMDLYSGIIGAADTSGTRRQRQMKSLIKNKRKRRC